MSALSAHSTDFLLYLFLPKPPSSWCQRQGRMLAFIHVQGNHLLPFTVVAHFQILKKMGSGFWFPSIQNTENTVEIRERDGRGRRTCQCWVHIFQQVPQKKNTVQRKVTTSVEEPGMMTVGPLCGACLSLPGGSLKNSVHRRSVAYFHIITGTHSLAKHTKKI